MEDEPRMLRQPRLHLLALVHPQVVQHDVDRLHRRGDLPVQLLQERDELRLPLPLGGHPVDLAGPRVEGGEQVQGPAPPVLVLDPDRSLGLGGQGRRLPRPRLQAGLLVGTEHDLVGAQRPGVEVADLLDGGRECLVPGDLGGEPEVMPPGLEVVVLQDPPDGVRGDARHHPLGDQLPGHLPAVPVRQGSAAVIRPLAGHLDQVQRHLGGKRPACGRVGACREGRRARRPGTARPTCGRAARSGRRAGRLPSRTRPVRGGAGHDRGVPTRRDQSSRVANAGSRLGLQESG